MKILTKENAVSEAQAHFTRSVFDPSTYYTEYGVIVDKEHVSSTIAYILNNEYKCSSKKDKIELSYYAFSHIPKSNIMPEFCSLNARHRIIESIYNELDYWSKKVNARELLSEYNKTTNENLSMIKFLPVISRWAKDMGYHINITNRLAQRKIIIAKQ